MAMIGVFQGSQKLQPKVGPSEVIPAANPSDKRQVSVALHFHNVIADTSKVVKTLSKYYYSALNTSTSSEVVDNRYVIDYFDKL